MADTHSNGSRAGSLGKLHHSTKNLLKRQILRPAPAPRRSVEWGTLASDLPSLTR